MRLALLLAVLTMGLLLGRAALEPSLAERVRQEAEYWGFGERVAFGSLDLDLPYRLGVRDITLHDLDGSVVARMDLVDVMLAPSLGDDLPLRVDRVSGRGGRIEIRTGTSSVLDVPFIRAITDMVRTIVALVPDEGPSSPMPPLGFRDLEVVIWAPGTAIMRFSDVSVMVTRDQVTRLVTAVMSMRELGGELVLTFSGNGLERIDSSDLLMGPAFALILGDGWGNVLANVFAPMGRVDMAVWALEGDLPEFDGVLRKADLEPPGLPFPLSVDELQFSMRDGVLAIPNTSLQFPEGRADVTMTGSLSHLDAVIRVHESAFKQSYLSLIPAWRDARFLECGDGGLFELALRLRYGSVDGPELMDAVDFSPRIEGGGGFLLPRARLTSLGLEVRDLMGRFTVDQDTIFGNDVSARLAGGRLRLGGTVNVELGTYELDLRAEDVDVERLHAMIHPKDHCGNDLAGWLQGSVASRGTFGDPMGAETHGQVAVRAGKFLETNLLTSIFQRAAVDGVDPRDDQRLGMVFTVNGRRLYLDPVYINLGSLGLTGTGWVDEQGRLALELLLFRDLDGFLGDVLRFLNRNLFLQIAVRGSLNDPLVSTYPVGVVTRNLAEAAAFVAGILKDEDG